MHKTLQTIENAVLYLTIVLFPIFVLPIFPNVHLPAKTVILITGICLIIILKIVKAMYSGKIEFSKGLFDFPLLLLGLSYAISGIIKTNNKVEAFFLPGGVTFVLAGLLLYLIILQVPKKIGVTISLFVSGVIAAVISLFAVSGILSKILSLPNFAKVADFSPVGGVLPTAMFLAVILPLGIGLIISTKDVASKILIGVSSLLIAFGLVISSYSLLPGKPSSQRLPSYAISYWIAADTLKISPLLGIGPSNYITAFNRFRPLSYNQSPTWATRFTSATNYYLTVLTETGFLGISAVALLLLAVFKIVRKKLKQKDGIEQLVSENFEIISLLLLILLGFFLPFNPIILICLFILLGLTANSSRKEISILPNSSKALVGIISLPVVAGIIALSIFSTKLLVAENNFTKALQALAKNDGQKSYEMVTKAVSGNKYMDKYHATRSQITLALANAVAKKKDLTEEDRKTISQLVQLAIAEGKATVALNPTRAGNWELLARTYQSIIPFAKGADQFAIQTYSQAIALDPINPNLRIALGGIYYAQGNFDAAIDTFRLAVLAKPDHANAHYNLSVAYREKKEYDKAIAEINAVLSLVEKDSSDYNLAFAELQNLEKSKPVKTVPADGEILEAPVGSPAPAIKPQLELPADAVPPEAPEVLLPASPTPIPTN